MYRQDSRQEIDRCDHRRRLPGDDRTASDNFDLTGAVAVPQLPDWDQYETVGGSGITLTTGRHVLRLVMGPDDYMDVDRVELTQLD